MQKKSLTIAVFLFGLLLVLLAHLSGRTMATPVFTFAEEREVYLTFDDGPSTAVTEKILDTLKAEEIKATFFVVGERIPGREKTLRRIRDEGHTIGVHSDSHRYETIYASDAAFLEDVEACADRILKTADVTATVYRFPGGGRHPSKDALLTERGYHIVDWNAVCGDEEIPGADAKTLTERAIATAKGKRRVVLLLHDSAPHGATAEALPAIIEYFRGENYVFKAF